MKQQQTNELDERASKEQKKDTFTKIMSSPYTTLLGIVLSGTGILFSFLNISKIAIYCVLAFIALYLIFISRYFLLTYFSAFKLKRNIAKKYAIKQEKTWNETADVLDAADDVLAQLQKEVCTDNAFKNAMEKVCQPIKVILDDRLGECAVCIKQICTDEVMNNDVNTWSTKTLARACSNKVDRSWDDLQKQSISLNTSFFEILSNRDIIWSSGNLEETIQAMKNLKYEYKNPDTKFQNFYHSTIVVPICRTVERISPKIREYKPNLQISGMHYLGFLCVDSLRTFTNEDQNFKEAMKITRTFGTYLYRLLEARLVQQLE